MTEKGIFLSLPLTLSCTGGGGEKQVWCCNGEKELFGSRDFFLAKIVCCNQNDRGRDHLLLNVLFAFGSKEKDKRQ